MATAAEDRVGPMGYLREALALLASRRIVVPAVALAVLLTVSNIVIASNVPAEGNRPGLAFGAAAFVRVAGLLFLAVAILRMMTQSARRPFVPDAGFWAYAATFLVSAALTVLVRAGVGLDDSTGSIAVGNAVVAVVLAPLALWFGALAVERPVPWNPAPWLRGLGGWLPHFLFWTLLVVTPLAVLHATLDVHVLRGGSDWFWPLMLLDGPLSTIMALFGLALIAAAYRRVAHR